MVLLGGRELRKKCVTAFVVTLLERREKPRSRQEHASIECCRCDARSWNEAGSLFCFVFSDFTGQAKVTRLPPNSSEVWHN